MSTWEKYRDMIDLPYPGESKHTRMPVRDRAAQFAPFAALTGFGAVLKETERITEKRIELTISGHTRRRDTASGRLPPTWNSSLRSLATHLQKPATSRDSTQISTQESRKSYFNRLHRTVYSVFSVKFTERTGDLV